MFECFPVRFLLLLLSFALFFSWYVSEKLVFPSQGEVGAEEWTFFFGVCLLHGAFLCLCVRSLRPRIVRLVSGLCMHACCGVLSRVGLCFANAFKLVCTCALALLG